MISQIITLTPRVKIDYLFLAYSHNPTEQRKHGEYFIVKEEGYLLYKLITPNKTQVILKTLYYLGPRLTNFKGIS